MLSGPRRLTALLLDLDGTLADTAPDMTEALNRLREEEGRARLPFQDLRPLVSHGAAALVRAGFEVREGEEFERLRKRFLALYAERLAHGTRLFPGFAAVLETCEATRIPWGIVTNKPGYLATPLVATLGLAGRAACLIAGDTLPERKPHPRPLIHAADLIGRAPSECVYVGDTERDIIAGRAAGMRTVAVRFGYLAVGEDPAAWQPDLIIDAPAELLALVGN
ncbi:MAG TPA: phosphoglycolate phosphatase [Steroidobacteraceae bacterium]|nr:phosphoglycolate phosphatase [Steroidobacteraceae bacterium]